MIEPLKSSDITQPSSTVTLNASTIAGHVAEYIEGKQLNAHQLVGIGTDGAAVMTEKNNGVVKKLQEFATTAIGIHCSAHRLQLASCQAANAVPFVKKFHTILRQLYDYYDNSAVRMAGLHAVQTALGEKVLKPIQPSSTRWLSIEMSTTRLKESYVSILVSLEREGEERGDVKAVGFFHLLSSYRFIATMLLLCDLLPHVSRLSKAFQAREFEYSQLKPLVTSTISTIQKMKSVDADNLQKLPQFITNLEKSDIVVKERADEKNI
ncbi:zinc finger protein 862-like [Saccoglossus kowalevskii]|uniref:Zinc finger protein 862-like n=1 Tax=Saccoglossus kowalevskii TaxID=10224 RepID=A0ABM0MR01_SACKO|nr:PREDICTED: zinc finger protein 862-like [Saccoglossus kowalevskii]